MDFKDGINFKLMNRIMEQLSISLTHYSKLLVVRLDFHCHREERTNRLISNLFKQITNKLKRLYQCIIGYVWVREQTDSSKRPHYHTALIFNGHKVYHPSKIIKKIMADINLNPYMTCFVPEHCFYQVHRNDLESQQALIYRLSYLAKNNTKETCPHQTKNYQISRNKPHEPNR
ncbi:YagK/YfjJ domain-containing protein [Photobacterium leiognathi]|uniref:YagK/YfjJ domain-containing protein n=1 Tax=Photobacterium leiognathi TaxID=553611 RepID=UPI002981D40C|nr:inovirus-type Gp2 protein [Photobacterium leiognathi]